MIVFPGWAAFAGPALAVLVGSGPDAVTGSRAVSYAIGGLALGAFGWWINDQDDQRLRLFRIPVQWRGPAVAIGALAGL